MNESFYLKSIMGLLVKIQVITGWTVPEGEMQNVLIDQFGKKLIEDYSSLNIAEIEYAFRAYGTTVKDWGKSMNLSLIDTVLMAYMHRRALMRENEAREVSAQQAMKALPAGKVDWKELCEYYYQKFLQGKINLDLWPVQMYDEFVECNFLKADDYVLHYDAAKKRIIGVLEARKEVSVSYGRKSDAKHIEELIMQTEAGERAQAVEAMAKKLAIADLYHRAKEQDLKNLFIQEEPL